jgi:SAM-dependent methyltransferase
MSTPLLSSPPEVVMRMLELADVGPEDVVYDLGCGDGRILIAAVERFNAKEAVGYEIREDVYEKALEEIAKTNLRRRIRAINGDFFRADLSKATVITVYLDSFANEKLRTKLEKEASPGTRIISHDFSTPGWRPVLQQAFEENNNIHTMYLYKVPTSFSAEKPPNSQVISELRRKNCPRI